MKNKRLKCDGVINNFICTKSLKKGIVFTFLFVVFLFFGFFDEHSTRDVEAEGVDLNSKNVLFESNVVAATNGETMGTLSSNDMTARFNGMVEMSDARCYYTSDTITYTSKAGNALVIQGEEGTRKWVYSIYISGDVSDASLSAIRGL